MGCYWIIGRGSPRRSVRPRQLLPRGASSRSPVPACLPPLTRAVPPRIGREYHPPSFRWLGLWAKGGRTLHVGPRAPAQDDASHPSCPEWTVEIFMVARTASPARLLLWEVTLAALRTLPKSGKQRVRGHVASPTPVVTPPPCPKVGRRWRPRSVSQSEERVSLGDVSGRPWLGCVRSVLWWAGLVGVVGRCASIVLRVGASARRVVVRRWVR